MTRIFIANSSDFRDSRVGCKAFEIAGGTRAATALKLRPRWRLGRQNRQLQPFCVSDDCELRTRANLFANQDLVQMVHASDGLIVESNNQIALSQSSALRRAVFLN